MFGSNGLYMFTFIGRALWYAGFASNANWVQANPQFFGAMPTKVVSDGNGALWRCGLPGGWVQDIPQPTFTFKEFMGSGSDGNLNIDERAYYIAALDTAGKARLIGNPTGGGGWVPVPSLNLPG